MTTAYVTREVKERLEAILIFKKLLNVHRLLYISFLITNTIKSALWQSALLFFQLSFISMVAVIFVFLTPFTLFF